MNILVSLIRKDLQRDLKRPGSLVLYAILPLLMTGLIAGVYLTFGGGILAWSRLWP